MQGTLVCGVTDRDDGRGALETAVELSDRLGLRLVLAYIGDEVGPTPGNGVDGGSSNASPEGAARVLERLASEIGAADRAEQRSAAGDPAAMIGQIAAEEAADVIVVGAPRRGRWRRGLDSGLAEQLATETPVPVVIAPPRGRAREWRHERRAALTSS